MPHPCVLFSSSPYLRYILGEKILNVNPKLTFSSQGTGPMFHSQESKSQGTGQRPASPPAAVAALPQKSPRGVQRGAALCPFAVFSHSNVIYPLRASAVHVAYSREPQSMRLYDRSSAIHAAIRPGPPQPMRLLFPHTKFRKYLINKVFPK